MAAELMHQECRAADPEKDRPLDQSRGTDRPQGQQGGWCGMTAGAEPIADSGRGSLYAADDAVDRRTAHRAGGGRGGIRGFGHDAGRAPHDVHRYPCLCNCSG
jgi:hypothetical protein